MAASTRPLTLGEILDRTVQLYRRNFLLLAGTAAPPAALIGVVTGAVVLTMSSQFLGIVQRNGNAPSATPAQPTTEEMVTLGLAAAAFIFIGIPLILGVFAMAQAALSYAATNLNRGNTVTMRASYGYAFRHFWRHVGILFLEALFAGFVPYCVFGALMIVGSIVAALFTRSGNGAALAPLFVVLAVILLLALFVACILIWVRLSLGYPASVAEDGKAWASLKRSNALTQGTRWRIFVMFLLVLVLTIVVSLALMLPVDILVGIFTQKSTTPGQPPTQFMFYMQIVNLAVSFVVRIFVMPIYTVALVLFYTDQRTRLEGYDIEQLMAQAGWDELPPLPLPEVPVFENPPLPSHPEGTEA